MSKCHIVGNHMSEFILSIDIDNIVMLECRYLPSFDVMNDRYYFLKSKVIMWPRNELDTSLPFVHFIGITYN